MSDSVTRRITSAATLSASALAIGLLASRPGGPVASGAATAAFVGLLLLSATLAACSGVAAWRHRRAIARGVLVIGSVPFVLVTLTAALALVLGI